MTNIQEIDHQLSVAVNTQDHVAYAASARVHWPQVLLDLREAYEMLDEANARILRQSKLIEAGNALVEAAVIVALDGYTTNGYKPSMAQMRTAVNRYNERRLMGGQ